MTERDGAAVRVHVAGLVALPEGTGREELGNHRREGLVDLDHLDVVPRQPRFGERLGRRLRIAVQHQVRIDADDAERDEARAWLEPELRYLRLGGDEQG